MRNTTSKLFYSILFPALFVLVLWGIRMYEQLENVNLGYFGLFPRTVNGLLGIITAPLLHADAEHLFSNTIPLLVLGTIMFFFYRQIAFQIFFWIYFMTGIWVWVMARPAYHIGASGIIYGFVAFLFFSGVFRKDTRLLALSLLVVFLYGSTAWGIFPIKPGMSWESHMMGALAGLITAYHFRKEGPTPRKYDLGEEEEDTETEPDMDELTDESTAAVPPPQNVVVNFDFIPKEKEGGNELL